MALLKILALLVVSTGVGVIAAEIALRVTHFAPAAGVHTVDEAEFERVPGLFGPGQQLVDWRLRALPHTVTINSLGYRGVEFPRDKPPGELRVLFVGDSFTYGDFVDDTLTVPALVEAELARACASTPVRVINAGVGGTTIVTHAAMVARAGAIDPDVVVLMAHDNDVIDMRDPLWPQMASNRRRKSEFPVSVVYRSVRDLAIWNAALRARATLRTRARVAEAPEVYTSTPEIPEEVWAAYRRRLGELSDSLGRENVPFVLTAFPSHNTIYRDSVPVMQDFFAAAAREKDIAFIDLFEPLRSSGGGPTELFLLPHDGHGSPAGNRLAAQVLAARLAGMPPLAGRCDRRPESDPD
jgi:hypothetical protein